MNSLAGSKKFSIDDRGVLSIPEYALIDAEKHFTSGLFRVFVGHHPLDWLSESNRRVVERFIQRHADVHLFGHMHDPNHVSVYSAEGGVQFNQAGALFAGRKEYVGYSLISSEINLKYHEVILRSYQNERRVFDKSINICDNGKSYSSIEAKSYWGRLPSPVNIDEFKNFLNTECLREVLSECEENGIGEKKTHDLFVSPPMVKLKKRGMSGEDLAANVDEAICFDEAMSSHENIILSAEREFGRTTVLQQMRIEMLRRSVERQWPMLPVLIEFCDIKTNAEALRRLIKGRAPNLPQEFDFYALLKLGHICLMVDDVDFDDKRRMDILRQFVNDYPKGRFVLSSLKNSVMTLGIQVDPEMPLHFEVVELRPFRRKDMRELIRNWNGGRNVEDFLDRIQNEIGAINLPFTAANGSIFIFIYGEGSGFTPINRSVLIEQFVDINLKKASADQSSRHTFDYRNKISLLAHVASWMAITDEYRPEMESLRAEIFKYLDSIGLKADVDKLIGEFLSAKLLIRRPENCVSFRYRAVMEYFIAKHMIDDQEFKDWVINVERYLSYSNELQYYAGLLRNDESLLEDIGERFKECIEELFNLDGGPVDLNKISSIKLPSKGDDADTLSHLSDQLVEHPLTEEEKDAELDGEIITDAENRQEVFRPKIDDIPKKFTALIILYSGLLKNMEIVKDEKKRRHLNAVWYGWSLFLHMILQFVSNIAKQRKIRINGVLYDVAAPKGLGDAELARLIMLNMPAGMTRLIANSLGSEKLERQLCEPELEDVDHPLVFDFFRAALIADLKLVGTVNALKDTLSRFRSSPYLAESLVWKIIQLRKYNQITPPEFSKIAPELANTIAYLKGGTHRERGNQKRKALEKFRREGVILKLKHQQDDE